MHSTLLHLFRIDRYKFKHCLLPLNRRRMACLRYSVEGQGCLLLVFPRNGDERIFSPKQADSSNLTYRTWFKFLVSPTIFSRSSPLCSSLYSKNSVKYPLFDKEEKIFRAHFRVEYTLWDKLYESWTKYFGERMDPILHLLSQFRATSLQFCARTRSLHTLSTLLLLHFLSMLRTVDTHLLKKKNLFGFVPFPIRVRASNFLSRRVA